MQTKKILDLDEFKELQKLLSDLQILSGRLQAIVMDYNNYISENPISSVHSKNIFESCENLKIRLSCVYFHTEMFCNHFEYIETRIKNNGNGYPDPPFIIIATTQFHYLFDSIIYHVSSVYDYVVTLVNFIHNHGSLNYVKWNSVAKSYPVKSEKTYEYISRIHKSYVDGFFSYRSSLIHNKVDFIRPYVSYDAMIGHTTLIIKSSPFMLKHFKHLLELSKTDEISLKFATFHIVDKLIDHVTDILFELKNHMENNKKKDRLYMSIEENGEIVSVSKIYWREDLRR